MQKEAAELSSRSLADWPTIRADVVERLATATGAARAELTAELRAIDLSVVSSREADKVQQKSYADALVRLQPMIDQWTASLAALDKKEA
ncbi:hypothetical protein ACEYYA_15145 [Paracoccus sp. p3-h83]|uniref:hypothetical protein n=1 Tax=Paracoccus sp. p3-h83 TaxID=3342805 RepID=UPI0035B8FA79